MWGPGMSRERERKKTLCGVICGVVAVMYATWYDCQVLLVLMCLISSILFFIVVMQIEIERKNDRANGT